MVAQVELADEREGESLIHQIEEFRCPHCGFITRHITESIREWGCPACNRGRKARWSAQKAQALTPIRQDAPGPEENKEKK